ncbi:MAG: asparagine synthase (glutamine-hydrolyzing) [Cryomorphaceae bacterium]|nr:MAG: asparagine synthase (glutamine-hydrolyzing) [Cryomorphaceae bacterium]
MCGIVGIVSQKPVKHREWLDAGRDGLQHRGPDDAGTWWSEDLRVGLAHRRLAIMDLSSDGHQPMHFPEKRLTVIFNGEIYNFRELRKELSVKGYSFHSQSDTEVLLAAFDCWGESFVSRLNGMFAFAIFDDVRQKIFLARDRTGEKPLFYRAANDELRFASELKALLADPLVPRSLNPDGLDTYLGLGFAPGDLCILEGFNKLPPAHQLSFDLKSGNLEIKRYWDFPKSNAQVPSLTKDMLLCELETLLSEAVQRQMVADVPVGVLLSGGVDSSLIAAMAVRHASEVRTFTIGFPGGNRYDERPHAKLVADFLGTRHHELMAEPTTVELFPELARQFDEPIVDSSMIPTYLVSKLVRQHCTVALGGDGGDELFGGYPRYNRLIRIQKQLGPLPLPLRKIISAGATHLLPAGTWGRTYLQTLDVNWTSGLPQIATYFDTQWRAKLLNRAGTGVAERLYSQRVPNHPDLLQRATRMDFTHFLAEDVLVKVDRASMMHALEVRAPMLDVNLLEFAFGRLPVNMRATATGRKIILKELAQKLLPPEFNTVRKQGFSIPLDSWVRTGAFRKSFEEVLLDESCMFQQDAVKQLFRLHDRGKSHGERLFALMLFELWRKAYGISPE